MNNIDTIENVMLIKAAPYDHQKKAFDFAMRVFGVFREEGDTNAYSDSSLRPVQEELPKVPGGNACTQLLLYGDFRNNNPDNLMILLSQSEHCRIHGFGKKKKEGDTNDSNQ